MCPGAACAQWLLKWTGPGRGLCFHGAHGLLQGGNGKLQKQQTRKKKHMIFNALKKTERLVRARMGRAECSADATFNLGPRVERTRGRRELSPRIDGRKEPVCSAAATGRRDASARRGEAARCGPRRAAHLGRWRPRRGAPGWAGRTAGYTRCSGANPAGMCPNARAAGISPHGAETEPRGVSIPPWMKVAFLHQLLANQSCLGELPWSLYASQCETPSFSSQIAMDTGK